VENKDKKIRVAQKAIIFNKNGNILTMRRSKTAPSRPLQWDLPGGDLEFSEDVKAGIIREIKEETGLEIKDLSVVDVASGINDINQFWVTICYIARPKTNQVILSYEHDDFRWVTPDEFQQLEASTRNKVFVERFKSLH